MDDLVAEVAALARRGVTEVTLLGQNVNSYGRDLTRRRPLFADLLRAVGAVEGIRRVRFTSPHPKDLRPETIARHGRAPTPSATTSTFLCSRAATGSSRRCGAATPPSATCAAWPTARAAIPDLAVTTDLIVGFPGENEDDFERTLEVVAEAGYDSAYTFVFSPAARDSGRGDERPVRPAEVVADRFERLRVGRRALGAWAAIGPGSGGSRRWWSRGPRSAIPPCPRAGPTQNKLVHFARRGSVRSPPARSPGSR